MMKDLSERIFKVLERDLEPKGILLVEQLPDLIQKLEAAIEKDAELRKLHPDKEQAAIDRLGQRAFPFLELMKSSLKFKDHILWGD